MSSAVQRGTTLGVGERRIGKISLGLLAWVVGLIWIFPVAWTVLTSFKTEQDASAQTLSHGLSFERYHEVSSSTEGTLSLATALSNSRLRRAPLDGDRDAARHPGRLRPRHPGRPEMARRPLLLHLHQVPAGRGVDLPDLRLCREVESDRHAHDPRRPLHRHEPAAGRVDDALVLHGGAAAS